VINTLLEKKLITTAGRKEVMGRPILYKSSKEFLMRFGLSDLDELPSLKEFEALAREALGSDEGLAPAESSEESLLNTPVPEASGYQMTAETAAPGEKKEEDEELLKEEVDATNEGMPAGETDETPKAAAAGE
jgi:segregation and condensation protein B